MASGSLGVSQLFKCCSQQTIQSKSFNSSLSLKLKPKSTNQNSIACAKLNLAATSGINHPPPVHPPPSSSSVKLNSGPVVDTINVVNSRRTSSVPKTQVPLVYWSNTSNQSTVSNLKLKTSDYSNHESKMLTNSNHSKPQHLSQVVSGANHNKLSQAVQYYSNQAAIERAATKQARRLAPSVLLYGGDDTIKMANYLVKELPIRIAHRIVDFRCLPFIAWAKTSHVHDLYIRAFHLLSSFECIKTKDEELKYIETLKALLDDHRDVVKQLADGFKACRKLLEHEDIVQNFIDRTLASRLGIRLLAEHYIALNENKDRKQTTTTTTTPLSYTCGKNEDHIGIINKRMKLSSIIEHWCGITTSLCLSNYGVAPKFKIEGHIEAEFAYFEHPLNYVLPELLKNSARATIETHNGSLTQNSADILPDITITIASNSRDFIVKISDFGGGVAHDHVSKISNYHFSTSPNSVGDSLANSTTTTGHENLHNFQQQRAQSSHSLSTSSSSSSSSFKASTQQKHMSSNDYSSGYETSDDETDLNCLSRVTRDMHGYGFGLPISRAYAKYLGGNLELVSMQGLGTDVYLRLQHLTSKPDSFLI